MECMQCDNGEMSIQYALEHNFPKTPIHTFSCKSSSPDVDKVTYVHVWTSPKSMNQLRPRPNLMFHFWSSCWRIVLAAKLLLLRCPFLVSCSWHIRQSLTYFLLPLPITSWTTTEKWGERCLQNTILGYRIGTQEMWWQGRGNNSTGRWQLRTLRQRSRAGND